MTGTPGMSFGDSREAFRPPIFDIFKSSRTAQTHGWYSWKAATPARASSAAMASNPRVPPLKGLLWLQIKSLSDSNADLEIIPDGRHFDGHRCNLLNPTSAWFHIE